MKSYSDPNAEKHYMLCDEEWEQLDNKLGKLCHFAAWNVAKSNGAVETSLDDIQQECFLALIRALMYYKRQVYIERGFTWLDRNSHQIPDQLKMRYLKLTYSWRHRKQFSGKNGFLDGDEELASIIVSVPFDSSDLPPSRDAKLEMNQYFMHYAKAIIWRSAKNFGAEIKKEKDAAARNVSLSDCDFLDIDVEGKFNELANSEQIQAVTRHLKTLPDHRPSLVWNLALNGEEVAAKDGEVIRRGKIRRATKMAYHTIRKQMKVIKKVINDTGGADSIDFNRVSNAKILWKDPESANSHLMSLNATKVG